MKDKLKIIAVVLAVVVAIILSFMEYHREEEILQEIVHRYVSAPAVILEVYQGSVSKYGMKHNKYDLEVHLNDSTKIHMFKKVLEVHLEKGTALEIIYNPEDLEDTIYVKRSH